MKVICRTEYHLGSPADVDIYKYKKGKLKSMIEKDYEWCKKYEEVENEDDVEDMLEDDIDEDSDIEIVTDHRSIIYEVYKVKED